MEIKTDFIYQGDALEILRTFPGLSINCCITSPPYWGLRDYGIQGQLGLERTPEEYVGKLVEIFREVQRVLRNDGTLWLNLGDCHHSGNRGGYHRARSGVKKNMGHSGSYNDFIAAPNRLPLEGLKDKDLMGIPWRVAFALQADGWYLRSDIIWSKPNPMPESVRDRPTRAHEYVFLLSKKERYYYDGNAIKELAIRNDNPPVMGWASGPGNHSALGHTGPQGKWSKEKKQSSGRRITENVKKARVAGNPHDNPFGALRNKRSVWTIATAPFAGAHFATFPPALIEPMILAGCPKDRVILDPFFGSGTTGKVALQHGRHFVGIELNPKYIEMANERIWGKLFHVKALTIPQSHDKK